MIMGSTILKIISAILIILGVICICVGIMKGKKNK